MEDNEVKDTNKDETEEKEDGLSWLPIGMCIGLSIGVAVGSATNNIGLWLPVGLCIGVALGSAFSITKGKKDKEE